MSWAESEKLNEWILRAYDNGRREEQERIIKLLEGLIDSRPEDWEIALKGIKAETLIALIKGKQA